MGVLPAMSVSSSPLGDFLGIDVTVRMSSSTTRFLFRVNRSQTKADAGADSFIIKYIVYNQIAF